MALDRIVAGLVVATLVLLDYLGILNPIIKKQPEEKKIIEEVVLKKDATISIIGKIGEYRMDEIVKIPCEITNTGQSRHSFPVNIQINGPGVEEILPFKRVMPEKGQSEKVVFEYRIPDSVKEGRFSVTATVWDHIEGSKPTQKYAQDKKDFSLVDALPQINFLNFKLSVLMGEKFNLKVKVLDDRGVDRVKIFYNLPGVREKKESEMNKVSGNAKNGVWNFTTNPLPETGEFVFYVRAIDIKSQIKTSEEYKIEIIAKR